MYDESPPSWLLLDPPPELPAMTVVEMPADVAESPIRLAEPPEWWDLEHPLDDGPGLLAFDISPTTGASVGALGVFDSAFQAYCQAKARLVRAAQVVHDEAVAFYGSDASRYVADELAMRVHLHPRSMESLLGQGFVLREVPGLLGLLERGELAEQHVNALLEESSDWTDDAEQRAAVIALTLKRCQDRLARGETWPSPAQLRRRLRTAAILMDLEAAEREEKRAAQRRGVSAMPSGRGMATLSIEGPAVSVSQMLDAIRSRAESMGRQSDDARTLDQRMFDAACELLTVDAAGGPSAVATLDQHGEPVSLSVRPVEVHVVMPDPGRTPPPSHGPGGRGPDAPPGPRGGGSGWRQSWGELPELIGFGPVTPALARELLAAGARLRRAVVDPDTGALLAVDDPIPRPRPTSSPRDPDEVLTQLRAVPVVVQDLGTEAYRPGTALRRFVVLRDRTCVFPGCTVPASRCDLDHVRPHDRGGPTRDDNLHALCRRHHQAKQSGLFRAHRERGRTIWTTRDGREHVAPPPAA